MIQRFILSLICLLMVEAVWSIPAQQKPFTVTNSDGTQLTIMLCGDECCHYYATMDGVPVVKEANGDWRLAPEIADSLQQRWTEKSTRLNLSRQQRADADRTRRAFGYQSSYTGHKKGIVLLVSFSDKAIKTSNTLEKFNNMFNQVGHTANGNAGSVHDYFYDQSYGQFNLTFDVYGPIQVNNGYSYYGENDTYGDDKRVGELTAEACRLAHQQYDINWGDYDWDGDLEVDQVYIIYAGNGEHAGAGENTIWPHESSLSILKAYGDSEGPIRLGGYIIDTYAMSSELRGTSTKIMDNIGTACHEFSHCLGLPDFYDTTGSNGHGMSNWSIMASGNYNGFNYNGECPTGFTAYERWYSGWLDLIELKEPTTITNMPCLHDEPVAYIIYNDGNRNEYFILENRQSKGWYKYVASYTNIHGLLVTHVDFKRNAWVSNAVNDEKNHQRMTYIPAGKSYAATGSNFPSQLFPGTRGAAELTNESHYDHGGKLFNKNTDQKYVMNKPITEIAEDNGLISFKFMGGDESSDIQYITNGTQSPTTYYTLDGVEVDKPTQPGIYLVKQGNHTRKFIVK